MTCPTCGKCRCACECPKHIAAAITEANQTVSRAMEQASRRIVEAIYAARPVISSTVVTHRTTFREGHR